MELIQQSVQYAHWHRFFEDVPVSSLDFYRLLEEEVVARKVPDVAVTRLDILEGGPLSPKRAYLKLQRDWITCHICAAPFGTGCFVSSRLIVWPFKSWPTIAVIGGVLLFLNFILFIGFTAANNSIIVGTLVTIVFAVPSMLLFAVIVIVWFIMCRRLTYYRLDTMLAFHDAIHNILIAQVNRTVEAVGRKPLTEIESKPILHKLLER